MRFFVDGGTEGESRRGLSSSVYGYRRVTLSRYGYIVALLWETVCNYVKSDL